MEPCPYSHRETCISKNNVAAEHTPAGTCEPSRLRAPNSQYQRQLNTLQTVVSRHHPHDVLFSVVLLVCMFQQKEINDQASRQISIGKLHTSRRVHIRPINLVIFQVPLGILRSRDISSRGGFHA